MGIKYLIVSSFLITSIAMAGPESDDPARPTLGKTGQIFTLKFWPGSKRITVGFAGKEAPLGKSRVTIIARHFPIAGEAKDLKVEPKADSFQIMDAVDPNSPIEIEVRDRKTNKSETFKLDQKSRP